MDKNSFTCDSTKNISIKCHFIQEAIEEGEHSPLTCMSSYVDTSQKQILLSPGNDRRFQALRGIVGINALN